MGHRRESEPSPFRTGIAHAGMSLLVFGGLSASLGLGIHITADPSAAGPSQRLALFDTGETDGSVPTAQYAGSDDIGSAGLALGEGDETGPLELAYTPLDGDGLRIDVTGGQGGPAATSADGIRINGKLVRSGESLSQVRSVSGQGGPVVSMATAATLTLGKKDKKSKAPADVYARDFSNPEGRPMVGLVIGGLGMNATQTQLAIDDLPANVTLSFALDSKRLDYWIKTARADGHEVLIEVPMEAFDYGRMKMHPDTLLAGADAKANLARLDGILSRAFGYFGIINYQGAKFASEKGAAAPIFESLGDKGLMFIDDGSLARTSLAALAQTSGLRYARAAGPIDNRQTPDDISAELMDLEALALEKGAAFGSGYAFPVTVEAVDAWIAQLEEKGLILAPVSAITNARPVEVRTGSLEMSRLKAGG